MGRFANYLAVTGLVILAPYPAQAETLSNDTIVLLHNAGISDEAIIAKIANEDAEFDTSTDALIQLSGKGITGSVIAAMIERNAAKAPPPSSLSLDSPDPMIPHPAGLYILQSDAAPRMHRIDYTVSNQAKTGGIFGYALTGGIASMSIKVAIANESARTITTSKRPIFYFFFDESNPATASNVSPWAGATVAAAASPNEFSLIGLMPKKGRREARVGSMNIGGSKMGVMDKDRLSFDYDLVRPGVYKVTPTVDLSPGEYGFIQAMPGAAVGGAMTARVFDFTVK
ncbi:MAG: hypothetical protein ACTHNA_12450 [Sphingopyxis terrae]|uniref:hypothetical protein n=1 Tax=Sphingopyxis terrae TaxID=33052 RepID=UPI000AE63684|nr:hypothetical protein [Sphingopyxis terrae]